MKMAHIHLLTIIIKTFINNKYYVGCINIFPQFTEKRWKKSRKEKKNDNK